MARIAAIALCLAALALLTGCAATGLDGPDAAYCKQNPYARSCYGTPVSAPPSNRP